jgi:hypothetical protein
VIEDAYLAYAPSFQLSVPPTSRELIDLRLYMFRINIEAGGDLDAHLPTLI